MMNGSIITCSKIVIETTPTSIEMSLYGLFTRRPAGQSFNFEVYGWWAPERLGSHACIVAWRRQEDPHTVESKYLHYQDIQIASFDVESHYFGLYITKLFMPPQVVGNYSVDLVIEGIIVASHPILIYPKGTP